MVTAEVVGCSSYVTNDAAASFNTGDTPPPPLPASAPPVLSSATGVTQHPHLIRPASITDMMKSLPPTKKARIDENVKDNKSPKKVV